jgi:hypothetical protein
MQPVKAVADLVENNMTEIASHAQLPDSSLHNSRRQWWCMRWQLVVVSEGSMLYERGSTGYGLRREMLAMEEVPCESLEQWELEQSQVLAWVAKTVEWH